MIIPKEPRGRHTGVFGALPVCWAGDQDRDGDAEPWLSAPLGSQYTYVTSSAATLYVKTADNGANGDWTDVTA